MYVIIRNIEKDSPLKMAELQKGKELERKREEVWGREWLNLMQRLETSSDPKLNSWLILPLELFKHRRPL